MKASKRLPWSKFTWQDHARDVQLSQCSLAAQGLWMRMLCLMHEATPYGHLMFGTRQADAAMVARHIGHTADEVSLLMDELEEWDVFTRTPDGTICSRRMIRDRAALLAAQMNGKKGGNPNICKRDMEDVHVLPLDEWSTARDATATALRNLVRRAEQAGPWFDDDPAAVSEGAPDAPIVPVQKCSETNNPRTSAGLDGGLRGGIKLDIRKKEESKKEHTSYEAERFGEACQDQVQPEPKPEPVQASLIPDDPKPALTPGQWVFRDGLAILAKLHGKTLPGAREAMAKVAKRLMSEAGGDGVLVKTILLDCEANPPRSVIPWMIAAIREQAKTPQKPTLIVDNDPNDSWGIEGFCKAMGMQPATGSDAKYGKWLHNGYGFDTGAKMIAEAARLPRSWRGDWTALIEWLDAKLLPSIHIVPEIIKVAGRNNYTPPVSLRFFNTSIPGSKAA